MKTTIELPDALFHRAKVVSAQRKITLKQLVIEGLENVIGESDSAAPLSLTAEQKKKFQIGPLGYPILRQSRSMSDVDYLEQIEAIRDEAMI